MENKEDVRQYMAKFIKWHKGVDEVAKGSGVNRVTLYQILRGRNGVSRKTIDKLAEHYPDLNTELLLGLDEVPAPVATLPNKGAVNKSATEGYLSLQLEIAELKGKLSERDRKIDDLSRQISELRTLSERWQLAYLKLTQPNLFAEQEGSKIESGSQTTNWEEINHQIAASQGQYREAAGFKPSYMEKQAVVIVHPATVYCSPVYRSLYRGLH